MFSLAQPWESAVAEIEGFEDIKAWQTGMELTRVVYAFSRRGEFAGDFALRDQVRKGAISVVSNIAEGFERGGNVEFIQFLFYAKGSAGEVEAQLHVACDQGYVSEAESAQAQSLARTTRMLLSGLVKYLQDSDMRGQKRS
jgi:four helix bundle protein